MTFVSQKVYNEDRGNQVCYCGVYPICAYECGAQVAVCNKSYDKCYVVTTFCLMHQVLVWVIERKGNVG